MATRVSVARRQPAVHLTLDPTGAILDAAGSPGPMASLFGEHPALGRHIADLIPAQQLTQWWVSLLISPHDTRLDHRALRLQTASGAHWALVSGVGISPESGPSRLLLRLSHITPVAEGSESTPPHLSGSDVYQRAFDSAASALALSSVDGRLLQVNERFATLVGRNREELIGSSVIRVLHADDWAQWHEASLALLARSVEQVQLERRYLRPDGSSVIVDTSSALLTDAEGRPEMLFTQISDITDHVRRTEELSFAAEHDPLTGLANRVLVDRTLERWLAEAELDGGCVAVVLIDLDEFKAVNDEHGHATGDALLTAVAARVSSAIRHGDLAGRIGGDEFVVLARAETSEQLTVLFQRLARSLRGQISVRGVALELRASLGMAVVTPGGGTVNPGEDPDEQRCAAAAGALMRAADLAMYEDKRRHSSSVGVR